jgi:hypothetical protein
VFVLITSVEDITSGHFSESHFYEIGLEVGRKASDLRASQRIKTPDAIQLGTAILYGATAFLANGRILERVKDIDILLDKFLKS